MPLSHQAVVGLRLVGMIGSLLGVFWLYRGTLGALVALQAITVFETVYMQCVLLLVTLCYYSLWKLGRLVFCTNPSRFPRGPQGVVLAHLERNSAGGGKDGEGVVPRLTIWDVWILVYGLGFVFFVCGYCFTGLHSLCLTFLGLFVSILGLDEVVCPRIPVTRGAGADPSGCYYAGRGVLLAVVFVALLLVSSEDMAAQLPAFFARVDVYSIFFGIALPVLSQLLLLVIRDSRRTYTLDGVIEICEFGFPFTAFLGLFHLCVAYGQRFQSDSDALSAYKSLFSSGVPAGNSTASSSSASAAPYVFDFSYWYHFNDTRIAVNQFVSGADGPSFVFYALTPLLAVPALVCFLVCVLQGSAIDPLLALTFSLSTERVATQGEGVHLAGLVLASLSLLARVLSEYHPRAAGRNLAYDAQSETAQLTHRVVWSRSERAHELTSDLETLETASV
jgi:hypothetical protein